jgi:hypothetical protein
MSPTMKWIHLLRTFLLLKIFSKVASENIADVVNSLGWKRVYLSGKSFSNNEIKSFMQRGISISTLSENATLQKSMNFGIRNIDDETDQAEFSSWLQQFVPYQAMAYHSLSLNEEDLGRLFQDLGSTAFYVADCSKGTCYIRTIISLRDGQVS